jgi:DNA polymerase III epsilon subunit-like protein
MAQPGICQIGAVKLEKRFVAVLHASLKDGIQDPTMEERWVETSSFYTLVNPETSKWEDGAVKTHGITPEQVKDAPTFFEIGPALSRFALGCDTWAGFNCKFDQDVIWYQLLKYGLERRFPWPPNEIDVMKVAGRMMEQQGKRGTKNPKLSEAYEHFFGKTFEGAHDALADIRATADVWRAASGHAV